MTSLRSRSTARAESRRLRFAGGGQTLVFGLTVVLILLMMFPGQILQRRLEHAAASDSLTIAYLTAWLRAKPEDRHVRLQLASHLYAGGEIPRSWRTLRPLLGDLDGLEPEDAFQASLLHLDLLERLLWTTPSGSLDFMHRQNDFIDELRRLAMHPAFQNRLAHFAERAAAMGERALARKLYLKLIYSDRPQQMAWYRQAANLALAENNPAQAARILLMALRLNPPPDRTRALMLEAFRLFQAADRPEDALRAAAAHRARLAADPVLLEALVRLALAANRHDLAEFYVALLLQQRIHAPGATP
jgi:tetratricopeptide (TPR) repeat protein